MSSVLQGEQPLGADAGAAKPPVPPTPPLATTPPGGGPPPRNTALTVIAGVGVLLLAMGVGVLIGRSGSSKQATVPAQVITVAGPVSPGATTSPASEATFTSSWPSATSGYTVQLQTLAQPGTTVSTVEAAKAAASAKGAKAVGALSSEEFSSLTAGSYVIYSGVYHTQVEAQKALAGVKKSFPSAKAIRVANTGSGSSGGGSGSSSPSGGGGSSESHPAPATVLKSLKGAKGKSYEEKSKSLPDVVETG